MRLLDLFCGAGGASEGYRRAGFNSIIGVDNKPQPNYPYTFVQADAITWLRRALDTSLIDTVDAIHASPPCQAHSAMSNCRPGLADTYPQLIERIRVLLETTGLPWVVENVPGSPLREPVWLCGRMFGLDLYRHRGFETNWPLIAPEHPPHLTPASKAGHWGPGTIMSVAGHFAPVAEGRRAMGIDWMKRDEMGEAIPPAYTEFVGRQLLEHIRLGRDDEGMVPNLPHRGLCG